jgi:hypothetical protein
VAASGFFLFENPTHRPRALPVLRRMPKLRGGPILVHGRPGLRDSLGPVHAGSFLRERRIAFDCSGSEFARIFAHEAAHFIWLRLGNAKRRSYEDLIRVERGRGELGWSAEWRKQALQPGDIAGRTRRWREYCCESFCDTAAWLYSGRKRHPEFTLPENLRQRRARWFDETLGRGPLSI